MYMDIPLGLALVFVAGGLWLLTWPEATRPPRAAAR